MMWGPRTWREPYDVVGECRDVERQPLNAPRAWPLARLSFC